MTKVDFIGEPDALLAADEVRERVADLNRALEHAARSRIGTTINIGFSTYSEPSAEVPNKIVVTVVAQCLSKLL